MEMKTALQTIILALLGLCAIISHSQPLSTSGRWIVDAKTGNRVKLHCVNWPGHLHAMIPEGLNHQPVEKIAQEIASMGFNCVRLTWATQMYTHPENFNLTAAQSLESWNLVNQSMGLAENNPRLVNHTLQDVQKEVIDVLHEYNVMVVIDNHVSFPIWCCNVNDGNGFFGDKFFHPDEWLQGLSAVASRYKGHPAVVAMSMRNELRGPRQNVEDWYKYVEQGAKTIHTQNPDLLVLVSGLSFDTNLSYVQDRPLQVPFENKLVFEYHWYSFDDSEDLWTNKTNHFCKNATNSFYEKAGFFFRREDNPIPVFLSEFGKDQSGGNEKENRYMTCVMATIAEHDIDFALWALQGSYMLRELGIERDETYGMLTADWSQPRNSTVVNWLKFVQEKHQEAESNSESNYHIMFHPQTGQCIQTTDDKQLILGDCKDLSRFFQESPGGPIKLLGSSHCVTAIGLDMPAQLTHHCHDSRSQWNTHSISKNHLAVVDKRGRQLCLDFDESNSQVVTKNCLCPELHHKTGLMDARNCTDNPQKQWFKLIHANVQSK